MTNKTEARLIGIALLPIKALVWVIFVAVGWLLTEPENTLDSCPLDGCAHSDGEKR